MDDLCVRYEPKPSQRQRLLEGRMAAFERDSERLLAYMRAIQDRLDQLERSVLCLQAAAK